MWNNKNISKNFDPKQYKDFMKIACFKFKRVDHRAAQCDNYKNFSHYKHNNLGL